MLSVSQEAGSHLTPNLPYLDLGLPSLQNFEEINFCCLYVPPSLWYFVCVLSHFSHVRLFETPWTVACQAPLSLEFFRQEYWSGLPFPPPGDLSNPGTELSSPTSNALAGGFFTAEPSGKPYFLAICFWLRQVFVQACGLSCPTACGILVP